MKTEIIADIGCNHGGDLKTAYEMVEKAVEFGANYAKFQYFSVLEIMDFERYHPPTLYTSAMLKEITRARFTILDLEYLKKDCDDLGIEFLCTPFINPAKVAELDPLVRRWKIRARDSENLELINAALDTGKEVFISTWEYTCDFNLLYNPGITWMFTVPKYPASPEDFNTSLIRGFKGYSNHVPGIAASIASAVIARDFNLERWVIEVHVKLDDTKPVDDAVSLTFRELKELRRCVDDIGRFNLSPRYPRVE